jgi:hypothetical protein
VPKFGGLGDLSWLSAFHSDAYRFGAVALVAVAAILVGCVPSIVQAWTADRRDQREHERNMRLLIQAADRGLERYKAGRLKLHD